MATLKNDLFNAASDVPLYQALYTHMRAAILSGELPGGMKLPSTRALADDLNVSRNTVLNAYRQLLAEGYLESREGSGTFVAHVVPELLLTAPRPASRTPKTTQPSPQNRLDPFSQSALRRRSLYLSLLLMVACRVL